MILPDGGNTPDLNRIVENLHRRDLGEIERAELLAKWVRITVDRTPNKPRQLGAVSKGGRGNMGGIKLASRDLGVSEGNLRRATRIAALGPEARAKWVTDRSRKLSLRVLEFCRANLMVRVKPQDAHILRTVNAKNSPAPS
ncbi:hypothetical protein ACEN2J_14530 [Pseudorhodobacter sp. W20_MBD10_FR17]|uniref:hypothetical protein n=1 Tax=Pseudorhodobacter sp. W20_MBD10_FR17 TaxID=3240266 RepID=UPI003F9B8194